MLRKVKKAGALGDFPLYLNYVSVVAGESGLNNSKMKQKHLVFMNLLIFPIAQKILLMILKDCRPEDCPLLLSLKFYLDCGSLWPLK